MRNDGKQFVWYDTKGKGKNLYAEFKRTFELQTIPTEANFHLFADSVYQLKVNGEFVGFGPVRFDPDFPMYDTYDLAQYLKVGPNVIDVIVNFFGVVTFKAILNQACFCAWGECEGHDLSTAQPGWSTRPSPTRQHFMQKISFALNPIEVYEQQLDDDNADWIAAVPLENQEAFGVLEPRSIPFMSCQELDIAPKGRVFPLDVRETILGFCTKLTGKESNNRDEFSNFIAFSTWIWSPKNQDVVIGTFWGETWLNGKEIKTGVLDKYRVMRINQVWELEEGWNFFFGKVAGYADYLYQMFAVPNELDIVFSAEKTLDSAFSFRYSKELKREVYEQTLNNKTLPYDANDDLSEIGGWTYFPRDEQWHFPARCTNWDSFAPSFEKMLAQDMPKTFRKELYPQGFSILFDLEYIRLVFPILKLHGVKGAILDITHSEDLSLDRQHLDHVHMYLSGDRVICKEDTVDFMPIQPRGMRYMMVTLRNTTQDVTFESLKFLDAAYPVKEIGSFESSDELLNNIWKMCALTQRTNMEDVYVDCTTRERGMYVRDTVIQYYNNTVTFGDEALMERCMQLYGQSVCAAGKIRSVYPSRESKSEESHTIVDFCLDAIEGYHIQYMHTGNIEPIKRDWEVMKSNLSWFNQLSDYREDRLLNASWADDSNAPKMNGAFFFDNDIAKGQTELKGVHCGLSCFYLIALDNMSRLGRAIGQDADAKNYEERAVVLRKNINKYFYDADFGAYKENLESSLHSNHASLFAIRSGAVTEEQLPRIRKFLRKNINGIFMDGYSNKQGSRFSPSFAFFVFDALYMAGLSDLAENLMKSGWSWFLQQGLPQCAEYFELNGGLSHCHAWSASPVYFLSRNVSGVTYPDAPNLDRVEIDIKTDAIDWAKVTLPHPKGVIQVEWHTEDDKKVIDLLKVPYGVTVSVLK